PRLATAAPAPYVLPLGARHGELGQAAHAELGIGAGELVRYGARRGPLALGDCRLREAAHDPFHDVELTRRERGEGARSPQGVAHDHELRRPALDLVDAHL